MRRNLKKEIYEAKFTCGDSRFDTNVENFKRRQALPPLPLFDGDLEFFDRVLNVKKVRDFIFVTKSAAKHC